MVIFLFEQAHEGGFIKGLAGVQRILQFHRYFKKLQFVKYQ